MAVYKSKTPTKDGRIYFFRIKYSDIFNITHDYTSQKFKTLKEAKEEEAKYRLDVKNHETTISNITFITAFNELMRIKKKELKKQSIPKIYSRYKYLSHLSKVKINDIKIDHYNYVILKTEKEGLSVAYTNKILELFRQIIKFSNKYYNTSDSMLKYIENIKKPLVVKKEMDFYTYEEYQQYDSVIEDLEWHTFFEILYFMGLRQGELQALTWSDVNFDNLTIKINKTLTSKIKGENWTITSPKTHSSIRTLPLTKRISDDLKSMNVIAKSYNDYSDNWFVFGNSIPFKESSIHRRKDKYCNLAKLRRIRIHDFRHSCASLLINKGASPILVAKYLGHSNITMTLNTYSHLYKSELDNIVVLINQL